MKLLLDANLSPRLARQLSELFPGSVHLFDLPLWRDAADEMIWSHAREHGFDIVTADGDDYPRLVKRLGPPPKVILLESWRYPTKVALELLRSNAILIANFATSDRGILTLRA
ncbi:MAG: DUF5615 family PIN-like protein [Acidobacteriaceae bacterium]|nr:DUF5615 family PIN-like protein [Acidobacteriaceae bacterium]